MNPLTLPPPPQNEYIGLGVLLLDLLVTAHGYVKDQAITTQLGVSGKVANRALRFLQAEGLLQSGALLPGWCCWSWQPSALVDLQQTALSLCCFANPWCMSIDSVRQTANSALHCCGVAFLVAHYGQWVVLLLMSARASVSALCVYSSYWHSIVCFLQLPWWLHSAVPLPCLLAAAGWGRVQPQSRCQPPAGHWPTAS